MCSDRNRPKRFNIPGHAHGLTFSCYRAQPLLACNHARSLFADSLNLTSIKYNIDVWAYVFMPEHVHLLIYPREENYSISTILKSMKQATSQAYIHWCRENRPENLTMMATGEDHPMHRFWQKGGGYDRNFWNPKEIRKLIDYIHMNPVRRGLVENPEDWEWSSAGFWMYGKKGRIRVERRYVPY